MALEKRKGRVEIVWNDEGTAVKGAAAHFHLFTAEGDYVKDSVEALTSSLDDPELQQLATDFSGDVVTERDALLTQVASLTTERDDALAQVAPLQQQVAELQSQLDALLNPPANPRHVAPFDFLALFTQAEQVAVFSSSDPTVLLARAQLQTIITYVDLDLADTVNFVSYLEQAGLIASGRAAQILAGEAPSV